MKLYLAALFQETNDFAPIPTGIKSFDENSWRPGNVDVQDSKINLLGYGGALERAQKLGLEVVTGPFLTAVPAARIGNFNYNKLKKEVMDGLRSAGSVDMVYLFLHGAMMAEGIDDCEGDLLASVREHVGKDVPIAAVYDLHGNVSKAMLENATFTIACKQYPHTDFPEASAKAVDLLYETAKGRITPVCSALKLPMMVIAPTTQGPFEEVVSKLQEIENSPDVLSVSLFHAFFGADQPDTGGAVIVYTDGDDQKAQKLAEDISDMTWQALQKHAENNIGLDMDTALSEAQSETGRVVLADRADNAGGGAGSDSTFLLSKILEEKIQSVALGIIWDPVAVDFCHQAGEGAKLGLRIGGKVGPLSGEALDVDATVLAVRDEVCQAWFGEGEPNLALGKTVAIRVDGVDIVLSSIRHQVFSRHAFEDHGINLEDKDLIVVKSTQHFYNAFSGLGKVIYCDLPGTVTADFATLPYQRITRPIWPLDEGAFQPQKI